MTQLKILAYISAHLSSTTSDTITFDTDSKEAIIDTGCSRTLTYDRKDFITYKETDGEVEGLGTHKIIGTGTVKYTVLDDKGVKADIICKDAIHVPTLDVRLLSPQQFVQQADDPNAEGVVKATHFILKWESYVKSVPYHGENNLPILVTAPGAKLAHAYISKHLMK